jgi:hypothetical protein
VERVIAENHAQIVHQVLQIAGLEQLQRSFVDLEHAALFPARSCAPGVLEQEVLQTRDAGFPPIGKQCLDLAEILQPQRDRRELEYHRIVAGPVVSDTGGVAVISLHQAACQGCKASSPFIL